MIKIDLHLHTKASLISDSAFDFSLEKLKEYVTQLSIDCIAITNHNLFDINQFRQINSELSIKVLPGIEIDFERGHLLLISEDDDLDDFKSKCDIIEGSFSSSDDYVTIDKLNEIFGDLNKYLLIPHYEKKPAIGQEYINQLNRFISAGEVCSIKKFMYCMKDRSKLVPLLFSDLRIKTDMTQFSNRQTYIDADNTGLRAIKSCLLDKNKVFLSDTDANNLFQIFDNGQKLSTGLNVILGERSTGKTYTLNKFEKLHENVKYIKQFELLETDEEKDKKRFDDLLSSKQSDLSEEFLKEFKEVVHEVISINITENEKSIENYLSSLLKVAEEEDRKDIYSKCTLFNESSFPESELNSLKELIKSTELLINNNEYREIIDKYLPLESLKLLVVNLIDKYKILYELNKKKLWVNSVVKSIQDVLQLSSSSERIQDVDLYKILFDIRKINKFKEIVNMIKAEREIQKAEKGRFTIIAQTKKYEGAQGLKNKSKSQLSFSNAFLKYENPIEFLEELKNIDGLPIAEYYKYFVDVIFYILNEYEAKISGGERSEFNLLDKIHDARHYDFLLIDEPESSFDNLFLKNDVNVLIKDIAKEIPVVIVTHNNTVGASINPDYVLYTKREIVNSKTVYKLFSGKPSDHKLKSVEGEEISNFDIMLNCLEAGNEAYNERSRSYEVLKD